MRLRNGGNRKADWELHRKALIQEGTSGKTVRDTLPNTSFPLTGEAEAIYFKRARDFLSTTLANYILCGHQDVAD